MDKNQQTPKLQVVKLHPYSNPKIESLSDRLHDIIWDYVEQESKEKHMITCAEIVGTLDLLKDIIKNDFSDN